MKLLVSEFSTMGGNHYCVVPFVGGTETEAFFNTRARGFKVIEVSEEKAKEMLAIQGQAINLQFELANHLAQFDGGKYVQG